MKLLGTSLLVTAGAAAGMVAGAHLAMNNRCVRRIYRYGRRYIKKMIKN